MECARRLLRWTWNGVAAGCFLLAIWAIYWWMVSYRGPNSPFGAFITYLPLQVVVLNHDENEYGLLAMDGTLFVRRVRYLDGWEWFNFTQTLHSRIGDKGEMSRYLVEFNDIIAMRWLVVAFGTPPAFWLFFWYRRYRQPLPGHCRQCGYNLTGTLAAGRTDCPECGASIVVPAAGAEDREGA